MTQSANQVTCPRCGRRRIQVSVKTGRLVFHYDRHDPAIRRTCGMSDQNLAEFGRAIMR